MPVIRAHGEAEELAEAEMNLGLILQNLAGANKARITDAIAAYQRALRTFDRVKFPAEFAILQNNLATAFLSIPFTDERSKMREALAVQAFEEGLKVVNLIDNPAEYAMLQNNLGNALQYASSSHVVENNLRALEAYDEALKVRSRETMPLEYANTISNKANCLWNLPDDVSNPKRATGRIVRVARADSMARRASSLTLLANSTKPASSPKPSIKSNAKHFRLTPRPSGTSRTARLAAIGTEYNANKPKAQRETSDMIGNLPLETALIALVAGLFASLAGGAFGGVLTGGKALGNELAAFMGSFYGQVAGTAGVLLGLLASAFML